MPNEPESALPETASHLSPTDSEHQEAELRRTDLHGAEPQEAMVRTAPKFLPFMIAGALVGILVGLVVSLSGSGDADYSAGSLFGYFGLLFGLLGLGLGAGIAVLLDISSRRRARSARLVRTPDTKD